MRRKAAWLNSNHTFSGEIPVLTEVRKETLSDLILQVEQKYKLGLITLDNLIGELNRLYMKYYIVGDSRQVINLPVKEKIKLHYSHLVISGEISERENRKALVKYWVCN